MDADEIDESIARFKEDLTFYSSIEMARRHIAFGDCAAISPEQYFVLRNTVASEYDLHPNQVLVVGSGKLGFSIAPSKRFRHFGDYSDLDVVIISEHFFDFVWMDVHRYSAQGGYWEGQDSFKQYLFRGWLRPDMLPPDQKFPFAQRWWEFFNRLSASREFGSSRVRGAVYKNWYFFEAYQSIAISGCAKALGEARGFNV